MEVLAIYIKTVVRSIEKLNFILSGRVKTLSSFCPIILTLLFLVILKAEAEADQPPFEFEGRYFTIDTVNCRNPRGFFSCCPPFHHFIQ